VKNIHKFIAYVVYNWGYPLNEDEIKLDRNRQKFFDKFKVDANDLNINITDEQLKTYIQRFDQLKNSSKVTEKDLHKYSLSKLIQLVTSSAGADMPEQADITPDVVYNNDNNTIVIYNGSKEGNCINFGQGERWCITRGSYGNYRYDADRGFPTFYLAKNTNLPNTDKLSFVAIQVRDTSDENKRYVYTNRQNSPYESNAMSFNKLVSEVPWLSEVPNLSNVLRYIPLTSNEKITQTYKNKAATYREWTQFSFEMKKQYLVARKNQSEFFSDISDNEFVSTYLPDYPQIAEFIALNNDIIEDEVLLKYLDKFSNQDRRSIMANMRTNVSLKYLDKQTFSFDIKKLLVKLNKWNLSNNERIYVTKNGEAIILLTLDDDLKVGVYTEDADYPNIKLNKRTSKFLADYPEIDTIPFRYLLKLASQEAIDKLIINKVIEKAKEDPNSAIIVKDTEDGQILVDSNSFNSYKIKDDSITPIPFDSEEVQRVLNSEGSEENEGIQNNILQLFGSGIPNTIDKTTFVNLLKNIPINNRITTVRNIDYVVMLDDENEEILLIDNRELSTSFRAQFHYNLNRTNWRESPGLTNFASSLEVLREYFEYARTKGWAYQGDEIIGAINSQYNRSYKQNIIAANPPLGERWMAVVVEDKYILLNRINPRNSKFISNTSGRLINYNFPPRAAAQYIGGQANAATTPPGAEERELAPLRRPGRPAGGGTPRQAPAAAAANPDVTAMIEQFGLTAGFNTLPQNVRNVISSGQILGRFAGDRGASRRNNLLRQYGGQVSNTIESGNSKLYIIRLRSGAYIGSAVFQPGNQHYIVTTNSSFRIPSPDDLVTQLRTRNINENAKVMLALHAEADPESMNELRQKLTNIYKKPTS